MRTGWLLNREGEPWQIGPYQSEEVRGKLSKVRTGEQSTINEVAGCCNIGRTLIAEAQSEQGIDNSRSHKTFEVIFSAPLCVRIHRSKQIVVVNQMLLMLDQYNFIQQPGSFDLAQYGLCFVVVYNKPEKISTVSLSLRYDHRLNIQLTAYTERLGWKPPVSLYHSLVTEVLP
jgi:hypothetical protein